MTHLVHKIICGDCIEVMKEMESDSVDLVVTDPPYGIGADIGVGGFGSFSQTARKYKNSWDSDRPSKNTFNEILRVGKNIIIFGGNYFADLLPASGHWIVWDKIGEIKFKNPFSDCELAWTSINKKSS